MLLHIENTLDWNYIDTNNSWDDYFQEEVQEAMNSKISLCQ